MHPFSDSDTSDSEDGIRFKTQSTRKKEKPVKEQRQRSPEHRKESRRRRSRSRSRHRHRSRSRDRHRHKKHRRDRGSRERQSSSRSSNSVRPVKSSKQVPESSNDRVKHVSSDVSRRKDNGSYEDKEGLVTRGSEDGTVKNDAFGPSLPPNFAKKELGDTNGPKMTSAISEDVTTSNTDQNKDHITNSIDDPAMEQVGQYKIPESLCVTSSDDLIGPSLPKKSDSLNSCINSTNIGPSLPPKYDENSNSNDSNDDCVGPALPLNNELIGPIVPSSIVKNDLSPSNDTNEGPTLPTNLSGTEEDAEDDTNIGPSLPADVIGPSPPCHDKMILGPALPSHLKNDEDASFGPSLPPGFSKTTEPKCIGPTLPAHLREKLMNNEDLSEIVEEEDHDDYGPLPAGANPRTEAHVALEERALQMKLDRLNPADDGKPRREEWMMELPSAAAKIGLGPRQFRAKEGPDMSDRSSWTDTPQDKEEKNKKEKPVDLKEEAELQEAMRRDKEQEAIIKNHKKKKKRDKSLLEQHQEKLKKKKEEESSSSNVRRPFSRDIDLKVNHFDEAQKKAIFKKAQMLDDRFSKGQTKYL